MSAGTSMLASGIDGGGGGGGRRRPGAHDSNSEDETHGLRRRPMHVPIRPDPVTDPYPVPNPRGFGRPGWRNEFQFHGTRHFGELEAAEIVRERATGRIGYVADRGGDYEQGYSIFEQFNINSAPLVDLDVPLPEPVYERPPAPQLSCIGRFCKKLTNAVGFTKRLNRRNRRANRKSLRRRRH